MNGSPRLDVLPLASPTPDGRSITYGGQLRLLCDGAPPELSGGPVDIVFSAKYFARARTTTGTDVASFAKVAGVLDASSNSGPRIVLKAMEPVVEELRPIPGEEHPVAGLLPPLSLHVEFASGFSPPLPEAEAGRVEGTESGGETTDDDSTSEVDTEAGEVLAGAGATSGLPALRLRIPGPEAPARFLELLVELQRDGVALVPSSFNGRLDVFVGALRFLVFTLEDAAGEPLANARVALRFQDGNVSRTVADAEGRVAINGLPPGECEVKITPPKERTPEE